MQMYEHGCPSLKGKKACPLLAGMLFNSNQVGEGKENSAISFFFVGAQHAAPLHAQCCSSGLRPEAFSPHRDKQGVERTRPFGLVA